MRSLAHHLDPVVIVGEAGLSAAVIAEADRALRAHELIKIRVFGDDRERRVEFARVLVEGLGCAHVQSIGKLIVLFRPRPEGTPAGEGKGRNAPHVPKKRAATRGSGSRRGAHS